MEKRINNKVATRKYLAISISVIIIIIIFAVAGVVNTRIELCSLWHVIYNVSENHHTLKQEKYL